MDERFKWEQRYAQAEDTFYGRQPSTFLSSVLPLLPPPGRCLDAGGGEGRNAVHLASLGWEVLLVDLALAGVATAGRRAQARGVRLHRVVADLEESPLGRAGERFDLVLAVNFHSRAVVAAARHWLRPGGALLVEGFAQEQLGRSSGGPQDPAILWHPNELLHLVTPHLRVVWYEDRLLEGDDNPRHRGPKWVVRLLARRPA